MGDVNQKLTIQAEVQGGKQSASDLQQIAAAQRGAAEATDQQGKASESAGKKNETFVGKHRDFIALLREINPVMAGWVENLVRSGEVAGRLASQNIELTKVWNLAGAAIKNNVAGLALLGAGGVAAAGIGFLISQVIKLREEAEKSKQALDAMTKAQTDIQRGRIDTTEDIVAARDRMRKTPSATAQQQDAIAATLREAENRGVPKQTLEGLKQILPALLGASNEPGGGAFSFEDLIKLAGQGFDPKAGRSADQVARDARRFLAKPETIADAQRIAEREAAEKAMRATQAKEEASTTDVTAGRANLEDIVQRAAKGSGVDVEKITREVRERIAIIERLKKQGFPPYLAKQEAANRDTGFFGGNAFTPPEQSVIDEAMRNLDRAAPANTTTAPHIPDLMPGSLENTTKTPGTPTSTIINHTEYNSRNYGAFARGQREAMVNGESRARGMEMV